MDMKCPCCCKFPAVFSHAQRSSGSVLLRSALLHQPTGAEAGLMESCSVRQKQRHVCVR
ncbi:40S ribosomal protein S27-like [Gymnogyps californianus]|uniref:40S ribosomal protein S27-like n=1 Tax=Gymnogyps californianus TaxID=33616 RepID=UPI0021C78558|nr:40S ribosomal protein S27-like [Gymnogyps californianus]